MFYPTVTSSASVDSYVRKIHISIFCATIIALQTEKTYLSLSARLLFPASGSLKPLHISPVREDERLEGGSLLSRIRRRDKLLSSRSPLVHRKNGEKDRFTAKKPTTKDARFAFQRIPWEDVFFFNFCWLFRSSLAAAFWPCFPGMIH